MPLFPLQAAKRALVSLLLRLALAYNIGISVNRDSDDNDVKRAFRKVSAKVHPDKGGATADFRSLNAARDAWLQAARAKTTDKGSGSASS